MKKRQATPDKSETFRILAHAIFKLEASKGHLAWKVTDLVRKSGFSRALIYRYLGSSKPEMLETAVTQFVNYFYGFSGHKRGASFSDQIRDARSRMIEHPEALLFCQRWRTSASNRQLAFIEIEARFQQKLKRAFPGLTPQEIIARHAVIHGLVTAPFLTADQAATIYKSMFEDKS